MGVGHLSCHPSSRLPAQSVHRLPLLILITRKFNGYVKNFFFILLFSFENIKESLSFTACLYSLFHHVMLNFCGRKMINND